MFLKDSSQLNLPEAEEKILEFWKREEVFEKSVVSRRSKKPFVFYEGPPTANGRPGIHHVLARSFKDIILRYKTMRGFFVPRRSGWDTHGLPVEIEIEKQLGLKSKKDIEKFGIAEFNKKCKESTLKYREEWEHLTERMGFWLDLKNPYITYETSYIETLWWIIKEVWKKKLLYKGHRVAPWCPRCGTTLSSHELAQGYKETTDNSVYVQFKLKPGQRITNNFKTDDRTYILSWTTTPWTLPGNVALAVADRVDYVAVKSKENMRLVSGENRVETENLQITPGFYILAKDIFWKNINSNLGKGSLFGVSKLLGSSESDITIDLRLGQKGFFEKYGIVSIKGGDLVNLEYEPLFKIPTLAKNKNSYKIYAADFVTTKEGTGVVHTAVMYGEDDYQLGTKVGLPRHHTVDEQGKFTSEVPDLSGRFVKSAETEKKIFAHLEKNGNLLKTESYTHEYPFCWRCDTSLLYYARTSWFVAMSKLRAQLLKNNKTINWIPEHLKNGRFGEWLREVKDWNFSRERYWGTPLPIWECAKCGAEEAIGGLDELSNRLGGPKNEYWVMRHGQSETQIKYVIDSGQKPYHLTATGRMQVEATAKRLKREKFDFIIASDILRTKETAEIISSILGAKLVLDKGIREISLPSLAGEPPKVYHALFPTYQSRFEKQPDRGESLRDLRARVWKTIENLEDQYKNKKILIISHEYPIWMLAQAAGGLSESEVIARKLASDRQKKDFIGVGEARPLAFRLGPRNETGELDLHRPYVDSATFPCRKCRGEMRRIPEIADVWFDSGSMPFAQVHWPFSSKKDYNLKPITYNLDLKYPADYISEAVDQTRGWFYTLLAVGTVLGKGAPYKNVVSLGHVNDKFGNKMSKSKGNVVDPWAMMDKYGADAVRWYFFTATPPGEPKNFDEAEIAKSYRKFHLILWNSLVFWKTYAATNLKPSAKGGSASGGKTYNLKPSHVLDKWILARLNETIDAATKHLDRYEVREAALALEGFVDDLSRWYIRRSRRRLSAVAKGYGGQAETRDYKAASATLGYVSRETSKLIAPFIPFFAEVLRGELGEKNSVHLADWPLGAARGKPKVDRKLLAEMEEVRRIASAALAKRAEVGIKVRQPLARLTVKRKNPGRELAVTLAEEVNVKEVVFNPKLNPPAGGELELDTVITPALKEEGVVREVGRMIQELRQQAELEPKDKIVAMISFPAVVMGIVKKHEAALRRDIGAIQVEYNRSNKFDAEIVTKFEGEEIWIGLSKK